MTYFQKQNPFRKSHIFSNESRITKSIVSGHEHFEPSNGGTKLANGSNSYYKLNSIRESQIQNPFEKSKYDDVFARKYYHSESKSPIEEHRNCVTFLPLSRFQAKMKLKQIDTENWRRQKSKQQRLKLQHFGPEALRYSNYSSVYSPYEQNYLYTPRNYIKSQYSKQKQYTDQKYKQRQIYKSKYQDFNQTPRSQYMLNFDKQQKQRSRQQIRNNESNTSIIQKGSGNFERNGRNYNQYRTTDQFRQMPYNNSYQKLQKKGSHNQFGNEGSLSKKQSAYFNTMSCQNNKNQFSDSSFNNMSRSHNKGYSSFQNLSTFAMNKQASGKQLGSDKKINEQMNRNDKFYSSNGSSNNLRHMMSYGSNFGADKLEKQNSYGSDYINEDEEPIKKKGPLDVMKFSSSSSSDSYSNPYKQEARPSKFGHKPANMGTREMKTQFSSILRYGGRQFYRITTI